MIPQSREKAHSATEQWSVRLREFLNEISRLLAAVHVVAKHDHHVERKDPVEIDHAGAYVVFGLIAGAVVADHGKLERIRLDGKRELLREELRPKQRDDEEQRRNNSPRRSALWTVPRAHGASQGETALAAQRPK